MQKLSSIQALRGVAALFVLLYHTTVIYRINGLSIPYAGIFKQGDKGVDLFFILSGFIMVYVHRKDMSVVNRYGRYIYARLVRIYPTLWIVSGVAIATYALHFSGAKLAKLQVGDLICSLLLLPQRNVPLVNVSWTLVYEVFFYITFGLSIINRRFGLAILGLWQLLVVAMFAVGIDTGAPAMLPFRPIVLEFGLGMGVGWLITSGSPTLTAASRLTAMASIIFGATLTVLAATVLGSLPRFATFGVASAMLVYGFARLERGGMIHTPKALEHVGDASYAIYLVHYSVIMLLVSLMIHFHVAQFALLLAPLVSIGGFAIGEAFYIFIDRPLGKALRSPFGRRATAQLATR